MNREQAIQIVSEVLEQNAEELEMTEEKMSFLLSDLGIDSLDTMLVMMEISEASGISISDDQAEELDTPAKIVEFLIK